MDKVFTLKFDSAFFVRLRAIAHKRGISIAALIRDVLTKNMDG